MKKIITALANPELNEKIKLNKNYEIIGQDIQYQEGVFEILEKNEQIEVLILNELIPGNLDIKNFITKIKEINSTIEIIIILEKENEELKNFLISKGIFNIFYNNKITIKELINFLNNNLNQNKINEEIKILKEIILNNKKEKNRLNKKINKIILKIKNKLKINKIKNINNKTIAIIGPAGVGKTTFCFLISKLIKNKKILIIDFNILNNNLNTIFNTKKYPKKINKNNNIKIEKIIIKINKNINLICGTEILFNEEYKIEKNKIKNVLQELKNKYDLIIIDTSSECFYDYTKEILLNVNELIFISATNLIELKKAKVLLNIYINNWKIKKEKIKIIFNKYNKNSIDNNILNNLFSDFNVLGKIKLNKNYDLIINKQIKNINNKIKKEYKKIIEKGGF